MPNNASDPKQVHAFVQMMADRDCEMNSLTGRGICINRDDMLGHKTEIESWWCDPCVASGILNGLPEALAEEGE